jgi:hypothetical protein
MVFEKPLAEVGRSGTTVLVPLECWLCKIARQSREGLRQPDPTPASEREGDASEMLVDAMA